MTTLLTKLSSRHALSIVGAVIAGLMLGNYLLPTQAYWVIIAAFFVSQTTRGTPLRQGIIYFLSIMAGILGAAVLSYVQQPMALTIILLLMVVVAGMGLFIAQYFNQEVFKIIMMFVFTLLIAVPDNSLLLLRERYIAVALGTLIAMVCTQLILSMGVNKAFNQGVILIIQVMKNYAQELGDKFLLNSNHFSPQLSLEEALQQGMYPEWVYELGFNPGLRSGFRYFLINLEQLSEILFSMNFLASQEVAIELKNSLASEIKQAMAKNLELMNLLLMYFQGERLQDSQGDYVTDIDQLESAVQRVIPNIDLVDISVDYEVVSAFARDVKDMRGLLLQLHAALPYARGT